MDDARFFLLLAVVALSPVPGNYVVNMALGFGWLLFAILTAWVDSDHE